MQATLIVLDDRRPLGLTLDDERTIQALLPGLPFAPWGGMEIDVTHEGGRSASLMHHLIPAPEAAAIIDRDQRGALVYGRGELVGIGRDIVEAFDILRRWLHPGPFAAPLQGRFRDS